MLFVSDTGGFYNPTSKPYKISGNQEQKIEIPFLLLLYDNFNNQL